ncbi:MAG: hypothetical protein QXU74_03340 [Candidatus Aenigmatarchaeota archaeon]
MAKSRKSVPGTCKLNYLRSDGTCAVDQLYREDPDEVRKIFPQYAQKIENVPELYSKDGKNDLIFILSGAYKQPPRYECNSNCKYFVSSSDISTTSERSVREV